MPEINYCIGQCECEAQFRIFSGNMSHRSHRGLLPFCRQAGHVLRTFGVGSDTVAAAHALFTRTSDADDNMPQLAAGLNGRDIDCFFKHLGHYAHTRFTNPTGAPVSWPSIMGYLHGIYFML